MLNVYLRVRGRLTLFVYRLVIDIVILIYIVFYFKYKKIRAKKVTVFILVHKRNFFLSLASILSINYYISGLNFVIVEADPLRKIQQFLYKKINKRIRFSHREIEQRIKEKIKKFKQLTDFFFSSGGKGKKFLISTLSEESKIIVLSDTCLFISKPRVIIDWISSWSKNSYHLENSKNFSSLSLIEASDILGYKPEISKLDSSLLCINTKKFWTDNSLKIIENYIGKTTNIIRNRLLFYPQNLDNFVFADQLFEKTLFCLTLSNSKSQVLKSIYLPYISHTLKNIKNTSTTFISYESSRDMYKYLFFSLLAYFKNYFKKRTLPHKAWFNYLKEYCPNCKHTRNNLKNK